MANAGLNQRCQALLVAGALYELPECWRGKYRIVGEPEDFRQQLPTIQINIEDGWNIVSAGGSEGGNGSFEPRQVARDGTGIRDIGNGEPIGGEREIMIVLADDEAFSVTINDDGSSRR